MQPLHAHVQPQRRDRHAERPADELRALQVRAEERVGARPKRLAAQRVERRRDADDAVFEACGVGGWGSEGGAWEASAE